MTKKSLADLAENYFKDTYGLSNTHSSVLLAAPHLTGNTALDIGSGRGRNTLFLAQRGYSVDALDMNSTALDILNDIIEKEGIEGIRTELRNLDENQKIDGNYDVVICTVVMMFLQPDTIPQLLEQMQAATNPGGLNIIVCPMDTEKYPKKEDFTFSFKEGELRNYYAGWDFIEYNENLGTLHRRRPDGSPHQLQFVTMIAKKPL
jgi:tellurite methyltransferase